MGEDALKHFRDRFSIPITDEEIKDAPFYKPDKDSEEIKYLKARREELGGYFFSKRKSPPKLEIPNIDIHKKLLEGTGDREISTTMAFVRILNGLLKDKKIGKHVVPIVPDEARTFGMEGMFRQYGIYSAVGQLYEPVDSEQVMYYREDIKGQILEEGINEAGGYSSWIAAATAWRNHNTHMIPFFVYYSMFGFQRIGDLAWASGDMRSRGFLIGGTAGRTTLAGEGLQHQDGHSHLLSSTIPNCVSYDPAFAYELAVIIQNGMDRMYNQDEDLFYYITVMNENYHHPEMPKNSEEGIIKGIYLLKESEKSKAQIQLLGSGTILREVIAASDLLEEDFGIASNIWSVTSFNELRREGLSIKRQNLLHPDKKQKLTYVESLFKDEKIPVVAATDYMKIYADQIREFIPNKYTVLGTDGFGRSDTRKQLRKFFEVNRHYIVVAALKSLADEGKIETDEINKAIKKYNIDPNKPEPTSI